MALAFPTRPGPQPKDPRAALIQALQSFEDALTDEQRNRYRSSCVRPDASSVLEFVAQIDASNKGRANRCVAPRLCTFLDKTRQFAGVVDTFVSSNPAIAALVWGGIKTTILSASNVASYFDRVTSMIMTIGRTCPIYQEFGTLYPGSVGLQNALCEYYAVIIRLCTKIIEVSQRSGLTHMFSSIFNPFESEFKQYQDELDCLARMWNYRYPLPRSKRIMKQLGSWTLTGGRTRRIGDQPCDFIRIPEMSMPRHSSGECEKRQETLRR
jgi:hypothetical protein